MYKMIKFSFRGRLAPVFTPFNDDCTKSLNLKIIPAYAKFLADNGIKGVLVNGTTGEGMSQSVQERKIHAEKWIEAKKLTNQHVMVQVGGAPFPDVLELATHAESIGVDSILCLPDLYCKPTTTEELTNYLKIVGKAAPNTPLLYYHIPSMTNVKIHMGQFIRDADGKIPSFVGMKFTSEALDEGAEAINAHNKKYTVFIAAEAVMLDGFKKGFDSAIATTFNIFPQIGVKIHDYALNGKADEAKGLQEKLTNIIKCTTAYGTYKFQAMKEAMTLFTPVNVGSPRDNIGQLSSEKIKDMEEKVRALL